MKTRDWQRGQRGMGNGMTLLMVLAVAAGGFVLVIGGAAYMDVSGFQRDLKENISEMQFTCLNADCEELFLEEIEELRVLKGRNLDIDWDNLDWLGADNMLILKGWKVVDFKVWKYYYYFTIEIPTHG